MAKLIKKLNIGSKGPVNEEGQNEFRFHEAKVDANSIYPFSREGQGVSIPGEMSASSFFGEDIRVSRVMAQSVHSTEGTNDLRGLTKTEDLMSESIFSEKITGRQIEGTLTLDAHNWSIPDGEEGTIWYNSQRDVVYFRDAGLKDRPFILQGDEIDAKNVRGVLSTANIPDLSTRSARTVISEDTKNEELDPFQIGRGIEFDFKTKKAAHFDGPGNYLNVMTWRGYGTNTDFSGGPVVQIGYDTNGSLYKRSSTSMYNWTKWKPLVEDVDTGWVRIPLKGGFTEYSGTTRPVYRYKNGVLMIFGHMRPPASNTLGSSASKDRMVFGNIPAPYRPDYQIIKVNQASGSAIWSMRYEMNGDLVAERYREGDKYVNPPSSAWMPFYLTVIL